MKKIAHLSTDDLTVEERNLLSVAYKNVIGSRRASLRIVTSIHQKEQAKENNQQAKMVLDYQTKVEKELGEICNDVLKVLDEALVPKAKTGEGKVFYYKMYALLLLFQERGDQRVLKRRIKGRAITTVTSLNLRRAMTAKRRPTRRKKLTTRPPSLRRRNWPLPTRFVSD